MQRTRILARIAGIAWLALAALELAGILVAQGALPNSGGLLFVIGVVAALAFGVPGFTLILRAESALRHAGPTAVIEAVFFALAAAQATVRGQPLSIVGAVIVFVPITITLIAYRRWRRERMVDRLATHEGRAALGELVRLHAAGDLSDDEYMARRGHLLGVRYDG